MVGRGASCFPQILEAVDSQEVWQDGAPRGLHGWVEQKQPLERRFVSSAKVTPSGPRWEVSRVGRVGEPHPPERGAVACGRHLREGSGSHGSAVLLEVGPGDSRVFEPLPCFVSVLPTVLPARAEVRFLKQRGPGLEGARPQSAGGHEREQNPK